MRSGLVPDGRERRCYDAPAVLMLIVLWSLAQGSQLKPDPGALPPQADPRMILNQVDFRNNAYRQFLLTSSSERRARFASLPPDQRSVIMRSHLHQLLAAHCETDCFSGKEVVAVSEVIEAASTAAYAGDPAARRRLETAESALSAALSPAHLKAVRSLLDPPMNPPPKTPRR